MSVRRNTLANYIGQGWTAFMGLAFVPIYIRYLGLEAWGLVGFFAMLQAWFNLLDMGLTPALSREMALFKAGSHTAQSIRDLLRSMEILYGGVALLVVVAIGLAAPWIAQYWLNASKFSSETLTGVIVLMGFVLAARMSEQVYRGAIQGMQRQVLLNGVQSGVATLRWAGAVGVLAWVQPSVEAFFIWQGLVSIVAVVIFSALTYVLLPRAERGGQFDWAAILRIRRFAGGMAITTLLVLLLTQVDKLLLSKLVSLEDFGRYSLAASAAGALSFLVSPIASAVLPRLTELVSQRNPVALTNLYHYASQWVAAILVPVALVVSVFAYEVLYVWTGDRSLAREASPLLTMLTLGTMCNGLMNVPYMTQLAHAWPGFAVRVNAIAVCLLVPLIWWAVPRFGAIGAAWAWFALNAGYILIAVQYMHKKLLRGEKWQWYCYSVLRPLLTGTIVALACRELITTGESRELMALILVGIYLITVGCVISVLTEPRRYLICLIKTQKNSSN